MLENEIIKDVVLGREEIAEILDNHTAKEIDAAISALIDSDDMDNYLCATRFFRDIINYGINNGSGKEIHESYSSFNFFSIIESNLFSEIAFKRNDAAYTVGKVCSLKSIPKLERSIEKFQTLDPEYVESAGFELDWLKQQDESA